MSDDLSRRHLLADEKNESPVEVEQSDNHPLQSHTLPWYRGALCIVSLLLLMSVLLNAVLLSEARPSPRDCCPQRSPYSISHSYNMYCYQVLRILLADLAYDTPTVFEHDTEFAANNETLADELWDGIDVSPITVALSDDWARDHGLEASVRFPWDDEKGLYFLKVFHSLHCLVSCYHRGPATTLTLS